MKTLLSILLVFVCIEAFSQSNTDADDNPEAPQLEDLNANDESAIENDYNTQQLQHFLSNPVNINSEDIGAISLITGVLADNIRQYRKLLGDFIDVHELIAVPGFTADLVKQLLPYITVKQDLSVKDIATMFAKGQHTILTRFSFTPEKAEGYTDKKFNGDRVYMLARYKYQYRNILQYGFLLEKDAGEKLFSGRFTPAFLSFHFFMRNLSIFNTIAIGDYSISLGQGLIQWQGQAYGKGAEVVNIKRQAEPVRPYSSAGEFNFNRGVAAVIPIGKFYVATFLSSRKLSSSIDDNGFVTSFQTSGLHRTTSELESKNNLRTNSAGISFRKKFADGHLAINAVYHNYAFPLQKKDEPYNLYAIKGSNWYNESVDYALSVKNFHLFGEIAADKHVELACVNGVIASFGGRVDASLLHRFISKRYQAVSGNLFSENGEPSDENGFYIGLRLLPARQWRIDIYADIYSFSWLRYRLDLPSSGSTYFLQLDYKPSKKTELYARLRVKTKPTNFADSELFGEMEDAQPDPTNDPSMPISLMAKLNQPSYNHIYNWRMHVSTDLTGTLSLRWRLEICHLLRLAEATAEETGYLFFTDLFYKPTRSHFSGNVRMALFECPTYDTRIYAYENDLLFVNSTPALYNNGVRFYVNLKGKWRLKALNYRQLAAYVKLASTVYTNVSTIGSGNTAVAGNRNSAIKMQLFLTI